MGRPRKNSRIFVCKFCKQTFEHNKPKKFCGQTCQQAAKTAETKQRSWMQVACSICGTIFDIHRSRFENLRAVFCSKKCCQERDNKLRVTRICENCGHDFVRPQSVKQTRFCSWNCYREREAPKASNSGIGNFGHFPSKKAGIVHFDSTWELERMKELDKDRSVATWKRSEFVIPWIDKTGKQRKYYPDFDIEYVDGRFVTEEIKGILNEESRTKIEAAKEFFKNLNVTYRVINSRGTADVLSAYEHYENEYGTWARPTFESVFMNAAELFSQRSTCVRAQVGAVFINEERTQILCFGYNGGIPGDDNQCESLVPGQCGCIHAEVNAMMKATVSLKNSTLLVTTAPCKNCSKLLISRGVSRVIYGNAYRDITGIRLLRKHGIPTIGWDTYVKFCDATFFKNQFNVKLVKPQIDHCDDNDGCCDAVKLCLMTPRPSY